MDSPQYKESTANIPAAKEDAEMLNDVISVCRESEDLYRYVAEQVDDQYSRNMFSEMAKVRLQIVRELESGISIRGAAPRRSNTTIGKISRWYMDAKSHFVDYHEKEFVEQLEEIEGRLLKELRSAVREIKDKSLAFRLASLVATFQISYDRMIATKKLHQ